MRGPVAVGRSLLVCAPRVTCDPDWGTKEQARVHDSASDRHDIASGCDQKSPYRLDPRSRCRPSGCPCPCPCRSLCPSACARAWPGSGQRPFACRTDDALVTIPIAELGREHIVKQQSTGTVAQHMYQARRRSTGSTKQSAGFGEADGHSRLPLLALRDAVLAAGCEPQRQQRVACTRPTHKEQHQRARF